MSTLRPHPTGQDGSMRQTKSSSRSGSKTRNSDDTKSSLHNRTYQRTANNATHGGKAKGKLRKDYQSRVILPNPKGDYYDVTPDPLTLEDYAPTAQPSGNSSNNTSFVGKQSITNRGTNSATSQNSSTSRTSSSIIHNSSYNASINVPVSSNPVRDLAHRIVTTTNTNTAAQKILDFFYSTEHQAPSSTTPFLPPNTIVSTSTKPKVWSETELLKNVDIELCETPTFTLINIPSRIAWDSSVNTQNRYTSTVPDVLSPQVIFNPDDGIILGDSAFEPTSNTHTSDKTGSSEGNRMSVAMLSLQTKGDTSVKDVDGAAVLAANTKYMNLLTNKDKDRYITESTETIGYSSREKYSQTSTIAKKDASTDVQSYHISDEFSQSNVNNATRMKMIAQNLGLVSNVHPNPTSSATSSTLSSSSGMRSENNFSTLQSSKHSSHIVGHNRVPTLTTAAMEAAVLGELFPSNTILNSEQLSRVITSTECVVLQNLYADQQLLYKTPHYYSSYPPHLITIRNVSNDSANSTNSTSTTNPRPELYTNRPNTTISQDPKLALSHVTAGTKSQAHGDTDLNTTLPYAPNTNATDAPILTSLWSYQCEATANRAVTDVVINPLYSSILAVSYGEMTNAVPETVVYDDIDGRIPAFMAKGMICIWSPQNPHNPLKTLYTKETPTSLAFCSRNPTALAVGFNDGDVHVYDITTVEGSSYTQSSTSATNTSTTNMNNPDASDTSTANANNATQNPALVKVELAVTALRASDNDRHLNTVWSIRWLSNQRDLTLLTASSDGHVRLWTVRHNLISRVLVQLTKEYTDSQIHKLRNIPKLKAASSTTTSSSTAANTNNSTTNTNTTTANTTNNNNNSKRANAKDNSLKANKYGLNPNAPSANVSLTESILALDVPADDTSSYLIACTNGLVYKCNLSFDEHPLASYDLHASSIYRITCSPYIPSLLLSCSSDGTVVISHQSQSTPLISNLCRLNDYIIDISWCPGNSTAFAFITKGCYLYLWDLYVSAVEPIFAIRLANNKSPNTLNFLKDSPVILIGYSDGSVQALHITNVPLSFGVVKTIEQVDLYSTVEKTEDSDTNGIAEKLFKEQCERLHFAILTHCDFDCYNTHEETD